MKDKPKHSPAKRGKLYPDNATVPGRPMIRMNELTGRAQKIIMGDYHDFKRQCAVLAEEGLSVAADIMRSKKAFDGDKLRAVRMFMEYGHGTPRPVPVEPGQADETAIRIVVTGGLPTTPPAPPTAPQTATAES